MHKIPIKDIGEFIEKVDPERVLRSVGDWERWIADENTKAFFDYLVVRKIEIQQKLFQINLDSQESIALANELKGGFNELSLIVDFFNLILGRSDYEENN